MNIWRNAKAAVQIYSRFWQALAGVIWQSLILVTAIIL